jgi:hypothetical protein
VPAIGIDGDLSHGAHRPPVRQLRPAFGDAVRIWQDLRERLLGAIRKADKDQDNQHTKASDTSHRRFLPERSR